MVAGKRCRSCTSDLPRRALMRWRRVSKVFLVDTPGRLGFRRTLWQATCVIPSSPDSTNALKTRLSSPGNFLLLLDVSIVWYHPHALHRLWLHACTTLQLSNWESCFRRSLNGHNLRMYGKTPAWVLHDYCSFSSNSWSVGYCCCSSSTPHRKFCGFPSVWCTCLTMVLSDG